MAPLRMFWTSRISRTSISKKSKRLLTTPNLTRVQGLVACRHPYRFSPGAASRASFFGGVIASVFGVRVSGSSTDVSNYVPLGSFCGRL